MHITIPWYAVPIIFFVVPFIYVLFRKSEGNFDFMFDVMLITVSCWVFALGFLTGKIFL